MNYESLILWIAAIANAIPIGGIWWLCYALADDEAWEGETIPQADRVTFEGGPDRAVLMFPTANRKGEVWYNADIVRQRREDQGL